MALAKSLLRLFVIVLLGFSCIIGINAVPTTRTKSLMHGNLASFRASRNSHLDAVEAMQDGNILKERKMQQTIELQDYPGSGANNRHTPRSRECVDC
ncbi:hypothetical protein BVRB_5g114650 [Beta vulgaris subsp. vulgaris]|uniref:uncharacterized protein LOC104894040 n=1 Tax=Beta vulgaris subsp. vulgaris TaxID=3555 RepID=UPI00053FF202|nr:uncharacterized protein LOC104894040 [Beta vulgaris subsp. vulgaris]KMT10811.1 hypothetical protein BVRB_5g114650 [Beta vulgaris subsp. vulgaris]